MIKTENNQRTVTFVHTFRVLSREIRHMMPKQFVTVFEHGLINWHIQISESGGIPFFIRNIVEGMESRPPAFQITLHPSGQRERHPPVLKVDFQLRALVSERDVLVPPLIYNHPGGFPPRTLLNACYSTPEQGTISTAINALMDDRQFVEFEVQSTIVFNVADFLNIKYINRSIGKPMPLDLGFRYNLLMNKSTHNFSLRTIDLLDFPCNKEALFVSSPFFRKTLTSEMTSYQLNVLHLEAIEVTITWMMTENYHPPEKMTPELAEEIVSLADRIVPRGPNHRNLAGSVERHCFEELVKNYEDLLYVKHMLLVAHNKRLGGLLEACHAIIISYHHSDFRRDMEQNPNSAFTSQIQVSRTSALGRFNENYLRSLSVRSYANRTGSEG